MNTFKNISSELKAYFSTNAIFKILLPIDVFFIFGGLVVLVLYKINFILGGEFFFAIGFYAMVLGLLLGLANYHLMFMYIGLLGSGLLFLIDFFWAGIRYGYWSFFSLLTAAIAGFLGYLVFKRSTLQQEG